jgi:hypothetical protein
MKTVALVIGNNKYDGGQKLDNAVNDANAIAESFTLLGYDVLLKNDLNAVNSSTALEEFEGMIKGADAAIFYFAGHGFQCEGENYLAAIECPTDNPNKHICERTCIRLSEILDIYRYARTKVNIAIIDACRRTIGRGTSNSFSAISVPSGTIIAFSTSPGDGAKDKGMDGHSVYTGSLLQYIGREFLSVEELFKKVRKTVFNFTEGAQTSWEHTSLVGDFFFNTGQLVYSTELPYDNSVIKDRLYVLNGSLFDEIIEGLKSCNWDKQNPAMSKLRRLKLNECNKNQLFLLGRNLLQASEYAFAVTEYFENLNANLKPYSTDNENHILNGILFEVYFDNNGDFRNGSFKNYNFDKILALRKYEIYSKSFAFIENALQPFKDSLIYIPSIDDKMIDVEFKVSQVTNETTDGESEQIQFAELIKIADNDITEKFSQFCRQNRDEEFIHKCLSEFLLAPKELINIISNHKLTSVIFNQVVEFEGLF